MALKHLCVKRADSVRSITLLGVMMGVKDTYSAMRKAFGPLYEALRIRSIGHNAAVIVSVPWSPQLPSTLPATGRFEIRDGVQTMVDCDVDMYMNC